jgi:hypothetical protein
MAVRVRGSNAEVWQVALHGSGWGWASVDPLSRWSGSEAAGRGRLVASGVCHARMAIRSTPRIPSLSGPSVWRFFMTEVPSGIGVVWLRNGGSAPRKQPGPGRMPLHREGCGKSARTRGQRLPQQSNRVSGAEGSATRCRCGHRVTSIRGPDRDRATVGDHHLRLMHATGRAEVQANYTGRSRWEPLLRRRLEGYAFSAGAESH